MHRLKLLFDQCFLGFRIKSSGQYYPTLNLKSWQVHLFSSTLALDANDVLFVLDIIIQLHVQGETVPTRLCVCLVLEDYVPRGFQLE